MKSDAVIERIKARVAAVDPNGPRTVLGVFQLNVKGASGTEEWIIDLKALQVSQGKAASPDVTVTVSDEDFVAVGSKALSAEDALSSGKVEVVGDKALANALLSKLAQ